MAVAGDLFGAAGMIRLVGGGYCRGGDPFGAAGGDLLEPQAGLSRRWRSVAGGWLPQVAIRLRRRYYVRKWLRRSESIYGVDIYLTRCEKETNCEIVM
jgi:hypothetical protein